MAINPINNSTLRLIGMSSGMDTDSIVQQMLRIHQLKIDSQFRSRTMLEWKQQSLNGIKDQITDFRRTFLTAMGANAMRVSSAYNSTIATLTGKNSGAVSVATTINTATGTLRIGQIESLAKATSVSTIGSASKGGGFKLTETLGGMQIANGDIKFDSKGIANVNINGTSISIDQNEFAAALAEGELDVKRIDSAGNEHTGTVEITNSLDYINAKIWEKSGNQIVYSGTDSQGNKFARTTINGKQIVVYDKDFNNLTSAISNNTALRNALSSKFGAAEINLDGFALLVKKNDTLADLNTRIESLGGPANYLQDGFVHTVNGEAVTIHSVSDVISDINSQISVAGSKIKLDSNKAVVSINGTLVDIMIDRNETFDQLNQKITDKYGVGIVFDQTENVNGIDRKYTNISIAGVSGTVKVYENDFVSSLGNSGLIKTANETPKLKGFTFDQNRDDLPGSRIVTINGTQIELKSNMTIEEMMQTINNSNAGVTMTYDRLSDQFKIENKTVGARNLTVGGLDMFGIASGTYNNGSMARVQINGEWVEKDANSFDYNGVRITLNEVSMAKPGEEYEETRVSFSRNAEEPLQRIRDFVDAYNTLIQKLEDLLKESKNRTETSYKPLTDEEKSLMTDKQIEDWEAIAKKGLLRNDSGIQNLISGLRNMLFDQIGAAGLSPSQLGLTTGRWDSGTGSQIVLDEDKLRAALENDPERVMNAFMGGIDSDRPSDKGLLWKMDDMMLGYINGSQFSSISSLENSIRRSNEQIDKLQKKMWDEEEKLYKKFAAMETALSKIQSQTDWMYAMLGMNNNNNK